MVCDGLRWFVLLSYPLFVGKPERRGAVVGDSGSVVVSTSAWHVGGSTPGPGSQKNQTKLLTHGSASAFVCDLGQSNQRLALPSLKKECGFHGKPHIN